MEKLYFVSLLFTAIFCNAQVGIGTITPQSELDIAGANTTIRIEKLNSINGASFNDGIKPAPAFVDGNGDIIIGPDNGGQPVEPINFLIINNNFVTDNPYGYNIPDEVNETGVVINNGYNEIDPVIEEITNFQFTVPNDAFIEVKYGITLYVKGEDMSAHPPPFFDATYGVAVSMASFFCIDLDNDGIIDASEFDDKYGIKGQYFETMYGGISGFPYMNGQAYLELSAGTYSLHFYGVIQDSEFLYTSVGFGGKEDYLKIRIYN
jgi:hypothetical protein